MKWTIHELVKKAKNNNDLDFTLDLNRYITETQEDLARIAPTHVTGTFHYDESAEIFDFDFKIQTTLTMLCALTLKEVEVKLNFASQMSFSTEFVDDDTHVIEGITIEIDQYIFSEILVEKPMKVYSKHALEEYQEDIYKMEDEELMENSPFAKIKKVEEE